MAAETDEYLELPAVAGIVAATVTSERPIVSLTFDDGLLCQRGAMGLLDERGLFGSFYVGTSFIGRAANRLTWDDLAEAQNRGHEIGGHTASHKRLTELSRRRAHEEVVRDRNQLNDRGFKAVTFAYPYGDRDPASEGIVREAGYLAGRAVGGVIESLPPENAYALRTPHSARSWTGSEDLAAFVRVAEHEACWMILVFHHFCEGDESDYNTPLSEFAAFLDWLVTRDVDVMRICDVVVAQRSAPAQ